jgi:hypothetical protein
MSLARSAVLCVALCSMTLSSCGDPASPQPAAGSIIEPPSSITPVTKPPAKTIVTPSEPQRIDVDAFTRMIPQLPIPVDSEDLALRLEAGDEFVVDGGSGPYPDVPLTCVVHRVPSSDVSPVEVGRACGNPKETGGVLLFTSKDADGREHGLMLIGLTDGLNPTSQGCTSLQQAVSGGMTLLSCLVESNEAAFVLQVQETSYAVPI